MIKNYIFDFGGVLYNININNTIDKFFDFSENKEEFSKLSKTHFLNFQSIFDYEKGIITTTEFRAQCKKEFSLNCTDNQFDDAWNSTLISISENAFSIINKYKSIGRIFLLSNSNDLHYVKFFPECKELFSLFEKCFFSFQIKFAKPDFKAFDHVINDTGIDKNTTLFIDDSQINIEAAKQFGLQAFLFSNDNTLPL
jgi:glucose-1-phosphatase